MSDTPKYPVVPHAMNCAAWLDRQGNDCGDPCTCARTQRMMLSSEQSLHAAWRKRAEEAEARETALEADNAALREAVMGLEMEVRQMMWLGHGHFGVYGDDGEMQCAECGTKYGMWDYKREPIGKVRETFLAAQMERASKPSDTKAAERKRMDVHVVALVAVGEIFGCYEVTTPRGRQYANPPQTTVAIIIEQAIRAAMEE